MTVRPGANGVLFASRGFDPLRTMTGIGRYVVELTNALGAVTDSAHWGYALSTPREHGRPPWLPTGIRYRPAPIPRRPLRLIWAATAHPVLERLIGDFDLVHALHSSSPVPTRRPAVVTVHDLIPVQHPEWYGRGVGWSAARTIEQIADGSALVIVDSDYVASQLRDLGSIDPSRISVVHLGIGDEFRERVPGQRQVDVCGQFGMTPDSYLLTVGNISTRKNLVTLIRAMARTDPTGPPLVLAGNFHTSAMEVQAEIDRLELHQRVRLIGFVPDEDLPTLVQGARALLHASVDEGFGLPPLEAMAAGTPVVAARAGSLPEIVGHAGLLVDATDLDEWANAISTVIADEETRQSLITAGLERAGAFTWDRVAAETHAVYQAALS